ncbi:biglycan-like [Chironomus tepperi]|uniref:biglycan-like n=1 Tax=Chironomus tepperi TaxID=113505 RepID=UPI00391F2FB3
MGDINCEISYGSDSCCIHISSIDTRHQKIKSFPSIQDPEIFKKVNHVAIHRGTLPTFPTELIDFFPNLKFLEINNSKMKGIWSDDLKKFTKLEQLTLDDNEIDYLPRNLFEFTPNLTHISFVRNRITRIGAEIFDNLKQLERADLSCNTRIDFCYSSLRQDMDKMKAKILERCEPIRSLTKLSMENVINNIGFHSDPLYVLLLAKHLYLKIE